MSQNLPRAEFQSQGAGSGYSAAFADTLMVAGGLEVAKNGLRGPIDDSGSTFDVSSNEDDVFVLAKTANNGGTYTLNDADTVEGRVLVITEVDSNAGTNSITVDTESSQTIDGSSSVTISSNDSQLRIISDGSDWYTF